MSTSSRSGWTGPPYDELVQGRVRRRGDVEAWIAKHRRAPDNDVCNLSPFDLYKLSRKGRPFDGQTLAPGVFRVARIRWTWHLQRPRFRQAAVLPGAVPDIAVGQFGAGLVTKLGPNEAQDLDLVVSYGEPYWPAGEQSVRDNSRLGPLGNDAGMWLTATSFRRSQTTSPVPEGLSPPLPKHGEEPNRIMGGAPAYEEASEMYWFVETITSRQVVEASRVEQRASGI